VFEKAPAKFFCNAINKVSVSQRDLLLCATRYSADFWISEVEGIPSLSLYVSHLRRCYSGAWEDGGGGFQGFRNLPVKFRLSSLQQEPNTLFSLAVVNS